MQREVDSLLFACSSRPSSLGRGHRLTEQKARATEGATYLGKDAVAAGLADMLGTFDDALVAARRAGVGATAHVVTLPKAAAALPAETRRADKARRRRRQSRLGRHRSQGQVRAKAQPKPASPHPYQKRKSPPPSRARSQGSRGEPSDKRIGFGWDEIIERQNARLARERGIRK